jgi:hypothetical protein
MKDGRRDISYIGTRTHTFLAEPSEKQLLLCKWNHIDLFIGKSRNSEGQVGVSEYTDYSISLKINQDFKLEEQIPNTFSSFVNSDIFTCSEIKVAGSFDHHSKERTPDDYVFKGTFKDLKINESLELLEEAKSEEVEHKIIPHQDNYFHFFKSLYELYKFDPADFEFQEPLIEYQQRSSDFGARKVLICHDIPGGNNQDPHCFDDFNNDH